LNLNYLLPRIVRHFLPENIVRFLLLKSWVIQPGLETSDPQAAVQRYKDVFREQNLVLKGKRVMVFGYGGRFDIGVGLLEAGAGQVILCEKYAPPDDRHNRALLPRFEAYLARDRGTVRPKNERLTMLQADIRDPSLADLAPVDLVISNSVYEHLDDVDGITRALAAFTKPDGLHVHFVDLRDHYFKYPFEMLCYSERIWRGWLNPSSNHNRYRVWDYRRVFDKYFGHVDIAALERDESGYQKARTRIRPEFISEAIKENSITLIRITASEPSVMARG
jgi:SAM-dependent methyltransferase